MSLFLQQPWLLPLLALVGLPLLVHLLSRTRPPVYRFSNLEFLQRVVRRTARLRKPKDWLLLALRTLAIAALAAAFLGPLLLSKEGMLPGEKRTVILLVDRSASMAARDGATTRFESAVVTAREALDTLRPDAANLVWIDSEPSVLFPEPAPNRSFLAESLDASSVRPEPGALARAWDLALRQCAIGTGRKELVVISDFQSTTWKNFEAVVPDGVNVRAIPVAKGDSPNLAVSAPVVSPAEPVAGQEVTVLSRVRNFSPEARRATLSLDAGGAHQSKQVDLPAWGTAEAAFVVRCAVPGLLPLTVALDEDTFPGDDKGHAILRVRESLRMAVAAPMDSPELKVARSLADSLPWLDLADCPDLANPPPCDLLLLPAWKGLDAEKLRSLANQANQGTTLLVSPAPGTSSKALATLTTGTAAAGDEALTLDSRPEGWQASPVEGARAFALFASGEFGNPLAGVTRQRVRLPEALLGKAELLGRFSDGSPALLSFPTDGAPILLSGLPLDPATGDWTSRPTFLPAFAELILHSRPKQKADPFAIEPGALPSWSPADPSQASTLTLAGPSGQTLPLEQKPGQTWYSPEPAVPGIYSWLVSGQQVHLTAVNFPDSESDLRVLPEPPTFSSGSEKPRDSLARAAALDHGLPLWPWLVALALLVLLIEPLLASPSSLKTP